MTKTSMPPALAANATTLARALISGIRTRSLYPAAHPNVERAVAGLQEALRGVDDTNGFTPSA